MSQSAQRIIIYLLVGILLVVAWAVVRPAVQDSLGSNSYEYHEIGGGGL